MDFNRCHRVGYDTLKSKEDVMSFLFFPKSTGIPEASLTRLSGHLKRAGNSV